MHFIGQLRGQINFDRSLIYYYLFGQLRGLNILFLQYYKIDGYNILLVNKEPSSI